MGTITCELEASYAAGTAGDDGKPKLADGKLGTTIPHQQRRRLTFAGNGKGKGRRLGDGGGGGTLAAGSWSSWCSGMFLRRRSNASISMQVFVRTLAGKSLALDVSPYDTVDAVKAKIQGKERVAAAEQRLVFSGRDLDDGGRTLADYGVRKEANLFLHLRLRGGAGGDVSTGGSHSHHSWTTAVGLLATVVAVAAALPYLPAAAAEDSGSLTPAFVLVVWAIAVGGVNLITAGTACTSGKTSSGGARSVLSKAAAFARQNIAVLGPSAASTAAAGITFSGADPVLSFVCFVLFLGAMSLTLFLVFAAGRHLDGGGARKTSGRGTSTAAAGTGSSRRVTAAGLLTALVAVGTSLTCFFPEPKAAGAGGLTLAMLLFSWSLAAAGVNMIAAGVCLTLTGSGRGESLSCTVLRKASAFAGQNLGVLGVAAASSAAAGVVVSGADADGWVYCFAWFSLFLVAMSGVTVGIASRESS